MRGHPGFARPLSAPESLPGHPKSLSDSLTSPVSPPLVAATLARCRDPLLRRRGQISTGSLRLARLSRNRAQRACLHHDVRRSHRHGGPSLAWLRSTRRDCSRRASVCPGSTPGNRFPCASPLPRRACRKTLATRWPLPAGKSAQNRFRAPLAFTARSPEPSCEGCGSHCGGHCLARSRELESVRAGLNCIAAICPVSLEDNGIAATASARIGSRHIAAVLPTSRRMLHRCRTLRLRRSGSASSRYLCNEFVEPVRPGPADRNRESLPDPLRLSLAAAPKRGCDGVEFGRLAGSESLPLRLAFAAFPAPKRRDCGGPGMHHLLP